MDYQTVLRRVNRGDIDPVYALYGTETFLMEEFVQSLKRKALDDAALDFNYSVYDMDETPIQQAVMDAETLPFMGERRIVIASNAFFLAGTKSKNNVEHDLDSVYSYLSRPLETTVFVFIAPADKLDARKKVVKRLREQGVVVSFPPLRGQDLLSWIVRRAELAGGRMRRDVAQMLEHRVGADLRRLTNEIEKMCSYVGKGGEITEEVVERLASRTLEEDIFSLIHYAAELKIDRAIGIFYDLLKNREEPLTVLHLLARQFRMILQVKILLQKGYSQRQIASQLGAHPYPIKLAAEKSNRFSEKTLRALLCYLAEEDFRIKSGQIDKRLSIELFLMKLGEMMRAQT